MGVLRYKDFGVDIDCGNDFVKALKPLAQKTFSPFVLGGLGGFSGCFEIPKGFKNPILCATTDGVGSKLSLAITHNRLENIGIDLVAMCVNDLICDFATPLFFLDYYATHKLMQSEALQIINGIVQGCKIAQCALIGGETAEMPSIYKKDDCDIAGFAVGIAEKEDVARRHTISSGDVILGIPSSGFHSNGFSLIRGIIETQNINVLQHFQDRTLLDWILEPTQIYVPHFLKCKDRIKGLAHITGGGLKENLIRILPENVMAYIDKNSLKIPKIFDFFLPYVEEQEAFRVFNMGVGMVVVVAKEYAESVIQDTQAYSIGYIASGAKQVVLE